MPAATQSSKGCNTSWKADGSRVRHWRKAYVDRLEKYMCLSSHAVLLWASSSHRHGSEDISQRELCVLVLAVYVSDN
jgi:hypothetical protein